MLKLTYTESGFRLERLMLSFEAWVTQRVSLTLCAGQKLYIEPSTASFLLRANDPGLFRLTEVLGQGHRPSISLSPVDEEFVEVSLKGSWIAESTDAHEGIFVATFSDQLEACIYRLWKTPKAQAFFFA
jgi:hypothetical protein